MDDILKLICNYLNKNRIGYVVVGGLVVIFHGLPRTTMDADIIIEMDEKKIKDFIDFLRENGFFASYEDFIDAVKERTHFSAEDKDTLIRLDIKGIYNDMDRRTFDRRRSFVFHGTEIFIASPEDSIANKIVYGSEQDIRDAEGIYVRQMKRLDHAYLKKICKEMGVSEGLKTIERRVKRYLKEEDSV